MAAYLSTHDNPWNPSTHFLEWFLEDQRLDHRCCDTLARVAATSDSLSDEENDRIVEAAIDEIIKHDPMNIYKKVKD